jgi:putative transposase
VKFIAAHKDRWGVEPICRVLQVAPASYYAAITRPPSARKQRDDTLKEAIRRIWAEHFGVYGADKIWAQLKREGTRVAHCTVERLMRILGLRGVVRGKTSIRKVPPSEFEAIYCGQARPAELVVSQ